MGAPRIPGGFLDFRPLAAGLSMGWLGRTYPVLFVFVRPGWGAAHLSGLSAGVDAELGVIVGDLGVPGGCYCH